MAYLTAARSIAAVAGDAQAGLRQTGPFAAVIADVKRVTKGCLNQRHPGNDMMKISASSETGVVTVKSLDIAMREYRFEE